MEKVTQQTISIKIRTKESLKDIKLKQNIKEIKITKQVIKTIKTDSSSKTNPLNIRELLNIKEEKE